MRRMFVLAVVLGALRLVAGPAVAQPVADHLKCYKAKDPLQKATYTADLGGLTTEPGCLIKLPAKLTCVPATKENVRPVPPGGGPTGTPNGFNCYTLKCPRTTPPSVPSEDQFGSRTVAVSIAKLLCAPFAPPTTSTTTTTTNTTTTVPTCAAGLIGCGQPCAGSCLCLGPGTNQFCSGVHCNSFDQACVDSSAPPGRPCSFDSGCPAGFACAGAAASACSEPFPGTCFPICPE